MTDSPRQYRWHRAAERCEFLLQQLDMEIANGTERRHVHRLVELIELHLDQTGPVTLLTAALRTWLAASRLGAEMSHERIPSVNDVCS